MQSHADGILYDASFPVTVQGQCVTPSTQHQCYECVTLTFVTRGAYRKTMDTHSVDLRAGHMMISDAAVPARYTPLPYACVMNLLIERSIFARHLDWINDPRVIDKPDAGFEGPGEVLIVKDLGVDVMQRIMPHLRLLVSPELSRWAKLARLYDILGIVFTPDNSVCQCTDLHFSISEKPAPFYVPDSAPPILKDLKEVIWQAPSQAWTVERLAEYAHMSKSTVTRLFQHYLQMTPARYVSGVRAHQLLEMLRETDLSVAELSHRVGLNDSSYAAKVVRAHTGMSPLAYRHVHVEEALACRQMAEQSRRAISDFA